MKKTKHLLIVLVLVMVTALMMFVVSACDGCNKEPEPEVNKTEELQSIELDTSNAKTTFVTGEAFTTEGLKVYANILVKEDDKSETEKRDVTADADVLSTAYKSDRVGTYTILVSYTLNKGYAEAEYKVTVEEARFGVDVILQEGVLDGILLSNDKTSGEIQLSADLQTVTIDPTKIEVRTPDTKGNIDYNSAALPASEYTVKVYKNAQTEITEFTNLGSGSYEIWVSLDNADAEYVRQSFVQVFVVDTISSLTIDETAEGTLLSQTAGTDKISSTWKFTATFASGATATVSAEDVEITIDTKTIGDGNAEVEYKYFKANGVAATVTTTVEYTITASGESVSESFVIVKDENAATKYATIEAGGTIISNSLFTATTETEMLYGEISNATRVTAATLANGDTVDFNAGLKQKDNTADGETTPKIEFEAKADITLKLYLVICNDSYNSNRAGSFTITILNSDGTVKETKTVAQGNRNVLSNISVELAEGEKVSVTATFSGNTFKLWLFGAEAASAGAAATNNESFVIVNDEDAATKYATIEAGGTIISNSLFTATTEAEMLYGEISNATRVTAATLANGDTVDFNAGLKQKDNTADGETTPKIEFEAKADITLKLYLVICNDSYNSNRAGSFTITILNSDGTVKETKTVAQGNRNVLSNISVELAEGEKVSVTATFSGNTFKLWLFGAEAEEI